ncbi:SDR family NAD(P)-dependent oxidoreductase [Aliikangiella maris]|uniref:SDR family NAD(P)-dependent oxidoreductase n=2 Tax=Aliikangiella maris TaxID=3162458 RepID=A0ABV3MI88_9GAMM
MDYNNKVIWITGATSGIGKALSFALAAKGAILILSGRNEAALKLLSQELHNPDLHSYLAFDLVEASSLESQVNKAWSFHNKIHILINNAGISQRSLALETTHEVDRLVMDIDYFAPLILTKSLVSKMRDLNFGMIVNIISVAGKVGSPMRSAYSGAKHALIGFMDSFRAEVSKYGIKIINVCPGFVKTNISKNALTGNAQPYAKMDNEILTGMSAEEFAKVLLRQLDKGKNEVIIAKGLPALASFIHRINPNFYHWVLPKIYQRNQ